MNKTIPKGYKQSEADTIPEGWEVVKLGDIASFFSGGTPLCSNKIYYSGNIPFIGSGDINKKFVEKYITNDALKNSSAKLVEKGDLLYALYGATSGEIAIAKISGAINQAVLCIRSNENITFLYSYLLSNKEKIISTFLQGGQGNLSAKIIQNLKIPLPPKKEQQKIAEILTTWDKAIDTQQKLISTQQQLKKGLMQQLLTGKTRFPEFSSKWQNLEFESIFIRIPNKQYQINSRQYLESGKFPIIDQGEKMIVGYSNDESKLFINDSVIVFGDHTRRLKYINFNFVVGADGTQLIKTKKSFNDKFFYYQLLMATIPNTGYNRHFKFLLNIIFKSPPLEEQKKIAKVLSLADDEINQRQKELEQLKQQKKALMQQLLTGKVRVKV